ncbi:DUF7937 domain-containing protein [Leucobacter sp. HY1910]
MSNPWQGHQPPPQAPFSGQAPFPGQAPFSGQAPAPGYGHTPDYQPQQFAPGYAPQPQPTPNAFANTPIGDWVRDGGAAVLLLVSLALPWSLSFDGGFSGDYLNVAATRVEVLLITLLSLLSLSIGYLARFGAFGPTFTAPRAALTRALLNIPYALLILTYVVLDALRLSDGWLVGGVGLGAAAAIGLTGAILAAVPRRYEVLSPAFSATAAKHGYGFLIGFTIFAGLATLLGVVLSFINTVSISSSQTAGMLIVASLLQLPVTLAPIAFCVFMLRRFETARLLAFAFGVAMVVGTLIAQLASQWQLESVWGSFGYATLLTAALLGVASHAGLPYAMRQQQPIAVWYGAMRFAPVTQVIALGVAAIGYVFFIIESQGFGTGYGVGLLVCTLLAIVTTLILRQQFVANFAGARVLAASLAGALLVLGIIATAVAGVGAAAAGGFSISRTFVGFAAPAAFILYGLFAPQPVREYYAANQPQQTQPAVTPQFAPPAAGVPGMPGAAPADPELAAYAMNPALTPQQQFDLAQRPEARVYLAQNPALYPDLRQWLAQTGDPAVLQALAARGY